MVLNSNADPHVDRVDQSNGGNDSMGKDVFAPGRGCRRRKNLPPFGSELAARVLHRNLPLWVYVFAGRSAWVRAADERVRIGDCIPLVWAGEPPETIRWPVCGCTVLVEIDIGPSIEQVRGLVVELLLAGAQGVLAWWLSWAESRPIAWRSDGKARELTAAEIKRTLRPDREGQR